MCTCTVNCTCGRVVRWSRRFVMRVISYTAARSSLATTMKQVCDDHDPIIVTRKNEDSVIIMSLEDYESLQETAYLSRSPKNIKRLLESIEQLGTGGGVERELTE